MADERDVRGGANERASRGSGPADDGRGGGPADDGRGGGPADVGRDGLGLTGETAPAGFRQPVAGAEEPSGAERAITVREMVLTAGRDKSGRAESLDIAFRAGEITALLGPTGSGKSRFLSDIESLACADTPTGRTLKLDGRAPDADERFELQGRLVAQLTQNMNFVLDLGVRDFVMLHAMSREVADPEAVTAKVMAAANELAGEPFGPGVQLTQLSGGQSRALMIADTALLSWSPVLLIDEIENAGVDKRKALDLLLKSDKIIVMATHDPVLALSADRRLVFEHGAVKLIQTRTTAEAAMLERLTGMEAEFTRVRAMLRAGDSL